MKSGAEPKKIAILAALLVVAALVLYFNVFSGSSDAPGTISVAPSVPVASRPAFNPASPATAARKRESRNGAVSEFKIRQGPEPGQDKPDPATIDPTLRLDLLAKVQKVEPAEVMRNIFQYGAAPPPPAAAKPIVLPASTAKIPIARPPEPVTRPGPPPPPPVPAAPPMTFKYYGYKVSKIDGRREAFLLNGDDIIIAGENDSMERGRYKIVRIGVNSITIEDTQFKSTQTLQLQADAA
jgi:hypothetical protein